MPQCSAPEDSLVLPGRLKHGMVFSESEGT
jgi:hypothetical protein